MQKVIAAPSNITATTSQITPAANRGPCGPLGWLNCSVVGFATLLPADAQRELNDPAGTGAGAERGRGRVTQAVKIGIAQVLVRTTCPEDG